MLAQRGHSGCGGLLARQLARHHAHAACAGCWCARVAHLAAGGRCASSSREPRARLWHKYSSDARGALACAVLPSGAVPTLPLPLTSAHWSACVCDSVMCVTTADIIPPFPDRPAEGFIQFSAEFSRMAGEEFEVCVCARACGGAT